MTFIDHLKMNSGGESALRHSGALPGAALREDLTRLETGATAKVVELRGSDRTIRKLEAMGIMPGMTILKKGESPMRGPIVLEKEGMLFAVGRHLAQRIIVEKPGPQSR